MKLKIKQSYSVRGTFVIRNEHGELIAREVSPELAAWIVEMGNLIEVAKLRAQVAHKGCACCSLIEELAEQWEWSPLAEDCEVEI